MGVLGSKEQSKCFDFVEQGSFEKLEKLLKKRPKYANLKKGRGMTLLIAASFYDQPECIDLLLSKGANTEAEGGYGMRALHIACLHGHNVVLISLLLGGADCDAKDKNGQSALHYATVCNALCRKETVRILLQYRPRLKVNIRDNFQRTPFHMACLMQHTDVAIMLLDRGADWTLVDKRGRTGLEYITHDRIRDEITSSKSFVAAEKRRRRSPIVIVLNQKSFCLGLNKQAAAERAAAAAALAEEERQQQLLSAQQAQQQSIAASRSFSSSLSPSSMFTVVMARLSSRSTGREPPLPVLLLPQSVSAISDVAAGQDMAVGAGSISGIVPVGDAGGGPGVMRSDIIRQQQQEQQQQSTQGSAAAATTTSRLSRSTSLSDIFGINNDFGISYAYVPTLSTITATSSAGAVTEQCSGSRSWAFSTPSFTPSSGVATLLSPLHPKEEALCRPSVVVNAVANDSLSSPSPVDEVTIVTMNGSRSRVNRCTPRQCATVFTMPELSYKICSYL